MDTDDPQVKLGILKKAVLLERADRKYLKDQIQSLKNAVEQKERFIYQQVIFKKELEDQKLTQEIQSIKTALNSNSSVSFENCRTEQEVLETNIAKLSYLNSQNKHQIEELKW